MINGRFLTQPTTGVQRFAQEMARGLVDLLPGLRLIVPIGTPCSDPTLRKRLVFFGRTMGTLWEQTELAAYMRRHGGILLNLCNTAPLAYSRNIVTVHDLGVFRDPNWYSRPFAHWYRFMTPRILRKALMVITVSRSSADELLRRFDVPPDKVHVVYNSIPAALLPEGEVPKEKMVLHVGSFSDRKNVPFIIEAFRRSGRSDLRLVLCGSPQRQLRYKATMPAEDANIEVHTGLSDQELGRLYAKASYIVCASHYEGFGMPVLEGIAHGAIPLLSDISVFRELYPKGPLFFSPLRPEELEAIFATLPDQYADPMPEIRKEYLKTFAHSRSVGVMAELMEELLHA